MGRSGIIYIISLIAFLSVGASWTDTGGPNRAKWHTEQIPWTDPESAYSEKQLDRPEKGYYRSAHDFTVPKSWPDPIKRRFTRLSNGEINKSEMRWSRSPLKMDTQFLDSKSVSNDGYASISVPTFKFFTFFKVTPDTATVDQDFNGHARISNLRDDQKYRIDCFDANGYIGNNITILADKYIKALPDQNDTFDSVRYPIVAQEVVEDRNKDIWASVYDINYDGTSYRFMDIYQLDKDFNIKSKLEVQSSVTSIRPWESDLILKDNGNLVFATSETPDGYGAYEHNGYIAEIDKKTGNTLWQAEPDETGSCLGIVKTANGYAYGGASWNSSGVQYGNIVKLDSEGYHTEWQSTGTTEINTAYIIRDMIASDFHDNAYTATVLNNEQYDNNGGTCSTTFSGGSCDNAYDGDKSTYVEHTVQSEVVVKSSFDSGVSSDYSRIYYSGYVPEGENSFICTLYLDGSNNDADWNVLSSTSPLYFEQGEFKKSEYVYKWDPEYTEVLYQYYRVRVNVTSSGGTWAFRLNEWELYDTSTEQRTESAPFFYTAGQENSTGTKLYTLAGTTTSQVCQSGHPAALCNGEEFVWDEDLGTFNLTDLNVHTYLNLSFPSSRTLAVSELFYQSLFSYTDDLNIRLQYWDGAAWNTYDEWIVDANPQIGGNSHLVNVSGRTENEWRIDIADDNHAFHGLSQIREWETYGTAGPAASIEKINGASGTTEGQEEWAVTFEGGVSKPGIFYSVIKHPRYSDRVYGAGSTDKDQTDLSQNAGVVGCVTTSGETIFYTEYPQFSAIYNMAPTDDGNILLSGTLYSGTSLQGRSIVIGKINKDGDLEWTKTFQEDGHWNDGRGIIETRDRGILAVGGSSDKSALSKPYFVKTNKFGFSCSHGNLCD